MNKTIQWVIWAIVLVAINIPTISFASFSLFGTAEETRIFSMDYVIAGLVLILGNIIVIHLFLAIRRNHFLSFIYGLLVAVAEAVGLYVFIGTFNAIFLTITGISIVAAIILLIYELNLHKSRQ
ncbi:hypothetical protein FQ085_15575 [Planococcus sp. ANT_H30]|uniref:hypothetical protein n=1 Tax=Planococcus sp. ANT_H30 TaxID=2597347 RepID=UPI0011EEA37C|nr:hypothetical protein [Planococcus sp. ANT_H30]KAA0955345.1 hypothetical protein FQ085_15575 [Planococcus sp. ANT_H30]